MRGDVIWRDARIRLVDARRSGEAVEVCPEVGPHMGRICQNWFRRNDVRRSGEESQAASEQQVVSFEPGRPTVRYPVWCETVPFFGPRVRLDDNVVAVGSSCGVRRTIDRIVGRIENF